MSEKSKEILGKKGQGFQKFNAIFRLTLLFGSHMFLYITGLTSIIVPSIVIVGRNVRFISDMYHSL